MTAAVSMRYAVSVDRRRVSVYSGTVIADHGLSSRVRVDGLRRTVGSTRENVDRAPHSGEGLHRVAFRTPRTVHGAARPRPFAGIASRLRGRTAAVRVCGHRDRQGAV